MLQSIKQLYGNKLAASDGEFGHVKDIYFDDQNWAVRYLVAETGTWLTSRQVLLSPLAMGNVHQAGKALRVNLTRKQIEDSPLIEWHKPVSRQFEEEYHRYFGWPRYWEGKGLWGTGSFPVLETPEKSPPNGRPTAMDSQRDYADAHLRSAQAVKGYYLQASDGIVGQVADFMMDEKSWAIQKLVIKTGHRFSGNEAAIPTHTIERISWNESTVFTSLTKKFFMPSSARRAVLNGAVVRAQPILRL